MKTLLAMLVWYGIFCFVTNEINPMEWGVFTKILAVVIALIVINDNNNDFMF